MPVMRHLNVGGTTYDTVGEASVTQVLSSGTKIATVSIDGTSTNLYAPAGGSSVDPATAAPSMDGTAAVGSSVKYAREDHVHPSDTSRQATLVSGTNIKTVNSESLLGSGNIAVQPTLVSGTNIKTINNESLLGSGNITTPTYTLPTASTSTLGGVKVDGTTITISDGVISSAGGGGGGFSKLTLYADTALTNLWVDQSRTTTFFESFDYDYRAVKSALSNADIIEVWNKFMDNKYTVVRWKVDPIDETFEVQIITGQAYINTEQVAVTKTIDPS